MNKFYIYEHYTLHTNKLFYIGKGCKKRAYSTKGRNIYWKRVVNKHGYRIVIKKSNLSEKLAFKYEVYYIKKLSPKCNFTKGGVGGNTAHNYTKEQLELKVIKCSKARTNWWRYKDETFKKEHLESSRDGVRKMWANMNPEEKSKEQSRRVKMKKTRGIFCLNNNKIYKTAKEAALDLGINSAQNINTVARGSRSNCKGYKFKYVK